MAWNSRAPRPRTVLSALLALLLLPLLFSCLEDGKTERAFDLASNFDSLKAYDHVIITMKDSASGLTDVLFDGKVEDSSQLAELAAPDFQGGKAIIVIVGMNGNDTAYHLEKVYDGVTRKNEDIRLLVAPGTSLSIKRDSAIAMLEGDSAPLPEAAVLPADLFDKTLAWSCSEEAICTVEGGKLRAHAAGEAELVARLASDTSKRASIAVRVTARGPAPESLSLNPDSLRLAAQGAPQRIAAKVYPTSVPQAVTWKSSDEAVAAVADNGEVTGLKAGHAVITATSAADARVTAQAQVTVTEPVTVQEVKLDPDSLTVYAQGAAEAPSARVLPPEADQGLVLAIDDSTVASVAGGKIAGLKPGNAKVTVKSRADGTKSAVLSLTVLPQVRVDSVTLDRAAVKLFSGGPLDTLKARVHMADAADTAGKVLWRSLSPDTVSVEGGVLHALLPGHAIVVAVSRADTTRRAECQVTVVRDDPKLDVGGDAVLGVGKTLTVTPKVTQEYGGVVEFRWDLDGDGTWDSTRADLQAVSYTYATAKTYTARFYVRDLEGNETTVEKNVKVVKGPVVAIVSPEARSWFNKALIDTVIWTVDGKIQDTYTTEKLKHEGADTIVRTFSNDQGDFSDSIVVFLDTHPPQKPQQVSGPWSGSANPLWAWKGGGGGMGIFRYHLDAEVSAGDPSVPDSNFPSPALSEGPHILFVQERDSAGNWSASGQLKTLVDLTRPSAPIIAPDQKALVNTARPTFKWTSTAKGSGGAAAVYRVALDTAKPSGFVLTDSNFYVTPSDLKEGRDTLWVAERDSASNWSMWTPLPVRVDVTPPARPAVATPDTLPVNKLWTSFAWAGAGGGNGTFKFKLDDSTLAGAAETQALSAYGDTNQKLSEGVHRLYVAERDSAGNWSSPGSAAALLIQRKVLAATNAPTSAYYYSLAMGPDSLPYVAYSGNSGITVKKFNPKTGAWQAVGGNVSTKVEDLYLAFDAAGNAYLGNSFSLTSSNDSVFCWKLNGSSWGLAAKGQMGHSNKLFALDGNGVMYVATGLTFVTVWKTQGGAWKQTANLNGGNSSNGVALAAAPNGEVYFAFHDAAFDGGGGYHDYGLQFRHLVDTTWTPMTSSLNAANAGVTTLTSAGDGAVYAAVEESNVMKVFRMEGNTLKPIGTLAGTCYGVAAGAAPGIPPYLGEAVTPVSATYYYGVFGFKGGSLASVGSISSQVASLPAIAVRRDGLPYAFYNSGSPNYNGVLMQVSFDP